MTHATTDLLMEAIRDRCPAIGCTMKGCDLVNLGKFDTEKPSELLQVVQIVRSDRVHAILALVKLDPSEPDGEGFRVLRNRLREIAHYLANHLNPPTLADDAHLWAVAPPGSDTNPIWKRLRAEVHQDTWSVPKSIWLPSEQPDPLKFLNEGVLAVPWATIDQKHAKSLDLIDRFAKKLGSRDAPWDHQQVYGLIHALTDEKSDPSMVARRLLERASTP